MSDLSLINLIRSEIARTEIGNVKRITGPAGEQGPQGRVHRGQGVTTVSKAQPDPRVIRARKVTRASRVMMLMV